MGVPGPNDVTTPAGGATGADTPQDSESKAFTELFGAPIKSESGKKPARPQSLTKVRVLARHKKL